MNRNTTRIPQMPVPSKLQMKILSVEALIHGHLGFNHFTYRKIPCTPGPSASHTVCWLLCLLLPSITVNSTQKQQAKKTEMSSSLSIANPGCPLDTSWTWEGLALLSRRSDIALWALCAIAAVWCSVFENHFRQHARFGGHFLWWFSLWPSVQHSGKPKANSFSKAP